MFNVREGFILDQQEKQKWQSLGLEVADEYFDSHMNKKTVEDYLQYLIKDAKKSGSYKFKIRYSSFAENPFLLKKFACEKIWMSKELFATTLECLNGEYREASISQINQAWQSACQKYYHVRGIGVISCSNIYFDYAKKLLQNNPNIETRIPKIKKHHNLICIINKES